MTNQYILYIYIYIIYIYIYCIFNLSIRVINIDEYFQDLEGGNDQMIATTIATGANKQSRKRKAANTTVENVQNQPVKRNPGSSHAGKPESFLVCKTDF
jgi:hypothetical protein